MGEETHTCHSKKYFFFAIKKLNKEQRDTQRSCQFINNNLMNEWTKTDTK